MVGGFQITMYLSARGQGLDHSWGSYFNVIAGGDFLQYPQLEFLEYRSDNLGTPRDEKRYSYSKVAIMTQPMWLSV